MLFLLKLAMLFIPKQKYKQKVQSIQSMDEKNRDADLSGWEYQKISATDNTYEHRFYRYPAASPDAPVILLLHGLNFDGRTFINMKPLAARYRLLAYDFPEESDRYTGKLDDFIDLIDDFLTRMGIKTCYLVGVSFGGIIALRFAALQKGKRVKKVVCISTPLTGYTRREIKRTTLLGTWLQKQADYQVYWLMEKMISRFEKKFPQHLRERLAGMLRIKKNAFYRQVFSSLQGFSGVADVKKIEQEMLVIYGSKDTLFIPEEEIGKFRALLPRLQCHCIENGTHAMAFLQGEIIAEHIARFFLHS